MQHHPSYALLGKLHDTLTGYHDFLVQKEVSKAHKRWQQQARLNQKMPQEPWHTWLILAGRGFGKTRTGAETVRTLVEQHGYRHIGLIGQTRSEVHRIMIRGPSGLHTLSDPKTIQVVGDRILWANGAGGHIFSGDNIDKLRGPQFDLVWIDEWAKFRQPQLLWHQVQMTLRLQNPKLIITTTPKPFAFLNQILRSEDTCVTRGSTFDNEEHLDATFLQQMQQYYADTSIGAQELRGEVLCDREGALWKRGLITHTPAPLDAQWKRLVIAVDPATTHHEHSDETGIIMVGLLSNPHCAYVLQDLSGRYSPAQWGQRVVGAYHTHKVDRVVVEANKGGDMVDRILQTLDPHISIKHVHATRGKITRAEPVAALYEQGKVRHARMFDDLERQMCEYTGLSSQNSPDRMDALVWAITDLLLEAECAHPRVWLSDTKDASCFG